MNRRVYALFTLLKNEDFLKINKTKINTGFQMGESVFILGTKCKYKGNYAPVFAKRQGNR